MNNQYRVGVDIGGTFTDIVVNDPVSGTTKTHKVLSTPNEPSQGMLTGLDELGIADKIDFLVHGTTAGLNALLSRTGERIALVTTSGFEDVAVLGRGGNRRIWSLRPDKPAPLVAPADIRSVRERVLFDGTVGTPLHQGDVDALVDWLATEAITSVAVCFLHAHKNPSHEQELKALLLASLGDVSIVLSHEVVPELGEFERTSTTVATAYVARTVERYLSALTRELKTRECTAPLHVMRSSGGICSAELVSRQPIQTILSGPAGGVVAAETLANALNRPNIIAIDMGGTSSDVSLVVDGRRALTTEGEIADQIVRMPVVELHTIGAGGGSIARVEAGGLRVGPKSAGATPGPACYGQGGVEPTVTDAQVLLGRIDPEWFLGGRMTLSVDAAERAVGRLATELNLDTLAAAEGILAVANAMMANAIRTLTLRRGIDPRNFSLLAFGGAGPLHGAALADELGIEEVIVPFGTGVLSAWGMLHADIRHDVAAPLTGFAGDHSTLVELGKAIDMLRARGALLMKEEGVAIDACSYSAFADMRYAGQEHAIAVEIVDGEDIVKTFHDQYRDRYGHSMPEAAVEFVNVRIAATGRIGAELCGDTGSPEPRSESIRPVSIGGVLHDARIVYRDSILSGAEIHGPAVVLESGSTTFVPPGWGARSALHGTLILWKVKA